MKIHPNSKSGLSLVEVLVASTVALIVIFGVGSIITDSLRAQRGVTISQNATFFTNQLTSTFATVCPLVDAGFVYDPAALSTATDITLGTLDMGQGPVTLAAGQALPNLDLTINHIRLKNLTDGAVYTLSGVNYQPHTAALYISLQKTGNVIGTRTARDTVIGVSIVRNLTDNKVSKCSFQGNVSGSLSTSEFTSIIEQASQSSCESNGGTWNSAPPVGENKCQFPYDCKYYGSYAVPPAGSLESSGFTNPLTNDYTCPAGTTPYKQGIVAAPVSCGKSCVTTAYVPLNTCMKCGAAAIPSYSPPTDACAALNSGAGCNLEAGEFCYPGPPPQCIMFDFGGSFL